MREVEIVARRDQRIEIVAADPALHPGKPRRNFVRLARADREQIARQRTQGLRRIGQIVCHWTEMRARSVSQ